uniref:Uncharacterized protein n=1 Tax=Romanomermis culicivorax TaxID=13658 RepID=A0A915JXV8_ROMCU
MAAPQKLQKPIHTTKVVPRGEVVCPSSICDYCFATNNCSNPSCPPSTIKPSLMSFNCPASRDLYFNALDEICYSAVDGSRAAPYTRYSVDYDYSLYDFNTWSLTTGVLVQGNNWFPLFTPSNRIPVNPGCALGYQPISGLIGYRVAATYSEEADDFVHLSAGYADQPVRARHFLKAYCFQSQNITFTKSWSQEGQYNVNVTLTDPTRNNVTILPSASVLVEIEFLVECPSLAILNRTIICSVLSPNISVDGYYAWAFGDGSLINFSTNRQVSYAYIASGVYQITVLRQSFSGFISTFKTNITVINCLCCPPYLTPLILSTDLLTPYTFYRYQTIYQDVLIQLSCSTTLKNSKIWAVRQVDPIDPTTIIRALTIDRLHQNDSFLTIDPYVLDFGLYEVNFTSFNYDDDLSTSLTPKATKYLSQATERLDPSVCVVCSNPRGWRVRKVTFGDRLEPFEIIMETTETLPGNYPIASSILGYFEVIPASITVVIYKNLSRIIISSNDTQFTSFVWSCVKVGSTMTSSSLDPDLNSWITNCDAGGGTTSLSVRISQQFFASTSFTDPMLVNFLYTSPQLISNFAQIKLIAMTPPAPGNCSINATNVRSIDDNVFLACSNWTSNYGIDFYFLYVLHPDGSILKLYAGPKFLHSVTLPAGLAAFRYQYSLMVTVYDYYGSSTDYNISAMQVMPYTNGFTENLLDQLNLHFAECNEFSVLLYVVSLATSLNTFYYSMPGWPALPAQTLVCSGYYGFMATCDSRSYSAFLRNQMLSALEQSTRRPRILLDISTISTAIFTLTTVIADVGIDGQQNAATMLIRMTSLLNQNYRRSSPNIDSAISRDYFKLTGNLLSVINYGIDFSTNVGDQVELQLYEYNNFDSSLPEDPNDIVYYEEMTLPEWQADAGRRAQLKVVSVALTIALYGIDQTAKNMSSIIQKAVDAMSMTLLYDSVLSNNSVTITIANGTMILQYCRIGDLIDHYDLLNESLIDFPAFCDSNPKISVCGPTIPIQSKGSFFKFPINLTYLNQNLSRIQDVHVTPALPKTQILKIHKIDSWKPNASLQLEFTPDDRSLSFAIFILNTEKDANDYVGPSNSNFSAFTLAFSYPFYWILSSDDLAQSTGIFYIGVGMLTSSSTPNAIEIGGHYFLQAFPTGYDLKVTAPSCLFYAKNDRHWEPPGCHVVGLSTADQSLSCSCYHLTVFGGGFFVPPNNVDFAFVFTHADFDQNITIYATIIIILLTYATLFIYCRVKDRKDITKLACVPLPENDISDRYIYEVVTSTGLMKGAATDSKVSFITSGSSGSSGTRNFGHPLGKEYIFRRGMVNHFILTCRRSLGDLHSVRIWHDNSGQGEFSGWFLNEIVIFDVQTSRKFLFVCNEWLAVDHADSCTDRVIPVADERKEVEFNRIFSNFTRQSLVDDHMWLSVFTRPLGTRFTRVQRLSCCFCFLTVSMLTSALWYGTRFGTLSEGYQIGPIYISDTEIKVGFFNNSIMIPLTFVLVNMFRKSSPRKKKPSRFSGFVNQITSSNNQGDQVFQPSQSAGQDGANVATRKSFLLPWWCRIFAWLLVILISIVCLVFTAFYAIEFGDNKTRRWLCSTILTFFVSVFFIQPIKITITSLFSALACRKKPGVYDADWIQDQDNPPKMIYYESITDHDVSSLSNLTDPPDNSKLEDLKRERQIELKMYADLREIFSTIFYICILIVLAYGNRGQEFYSHQANLYNLFLAPNDPNSALITQVKTINTYWQWAKTVLAPALRAPHYINGEPNIMERGFIVDHTNRLLGHAIMRQVRIQPTDWIIDIKASCFSRQLVDGRLMLALVDDLKPDVPERISC